jgi:nicotinate dehydrogenase subunit B
MMPRPGEPPLGAGESSSVPGTAAIANAIFDATGVRLRKPPFTPEVVREGLYADPNLPFRHTPSAQAAIQNIALVGAVLGADPPRVPLLASAKPLWAALGGAALGVLGMAASYLGWPQAMSPMAAGSTAGIYSPATIERGRQLAALGDCMVCHTNEDGAVPGQRGAGGRAMHTPFGTVYTTNLTPDAETGIGNWSLEAFKARHA